MWIAGGLRLRPTSVKWGKMGCVVYMKRLSESFHKFLERVKRDWDTVSWPSFRELLVKKQVDTTTGRS
jgi:hypothetical protein